MMTFQCDSGDSCHRINVTHKTIQVVEQLLQRVVQQFSNFCAFKLLWQLTRMPVQLKTPI
ncbi:hypothetical protein CQ012_06305 [Arthrobacter sp. MYb214]|nr:hypothetical protein CQ012_06305 [Arthrobacter sp. MYb214]